MQGTAGWVGKNQFNLKENQYLSKCHDILLQCTEIHYTKMFNVFWWKKKQKHPTKTFSQEQNIRLKVKPMIANHTKSRTQHQQLLGGPGPLKLDVWSPNFQKSYFLVIWLGNEDSKWIVTRKRKVSAQNTKFYLSHFPFVKVCYSNS